MTDWVITYHAVERFVERHVPELDVHRARVVMQHAIQDATKLPSVSPSGSEHWLLKPFNVILVVDMQRGGKRVVVTVLPDLWRSKRRSRRRRGCAPPAAKAS